MNRSWLRNGFSLVELAVTLAVVGTLGMATWKLLPLVQSSASGDTTGRELEQARLSVEGFALAHSRLPCPDTNGDGVEDCTSGSVVGWFPNRTVGYTPATRLRYGVYRVPSSIPAADADLATAKDRFTPTLPPGYASTNINGLDLCLALRNAIAAPVGLTAGNVPVAYAIAHPGKGDTDGDGNPFDGAQAANGFDLPGQAQISTDDDRVVAAGLAELSSRLSCPTRLDAANGAARSAYAAWDLDRFAQGYKDFRSFAYQVRQTNTTMAGVNEALATLDLANAYGTSLSGIALAAESGGLGGATVAAATAAIGAAWAALGVQTASLASAILAEQKALDQLNAASAYQVMTKQWFDQAITAAQAADAKGLLP